MDDELFFCHVDKHRSVLQVNTFKLIILGAQSIQNKYPKYPISCNISRKHGDEVDIFPADMHESLLQIDTMILMGMEVRKMFAIY